MTSRRIDWPDVLFGLFLIVAAAGTFAATWKLAGGTAANMGPGYVPRALAFALFAFGAFFAGRGFMRAHVAISRVHLRPILGVSIGVGIFALLIGRAGLAVASFASLIVAAAASRESKFFEVILFGLFITAGSVLLFVKALNLPVPIWSW